MITDINIEHNNTSKNNISTQVKTEESKELDKSKISTKKKKDLPPIDKSNHALRFSQYTWRKFIIPEQNEKISYLEPFDYLSNIDKTVDFTKMHFRNEMDMLNKASLETPSINYYHPSYKLLEERSPKVIFSPSSLRKNNKRYLLNKLWASYDVTQEYKLVNNEKLGEPNFDYLQIKNEK